jgi:hypothetical protein
MILVSILAVMRENDVRGYWFETFEEVLYSRSIEREEAVAKVADNDLFSSRVLEEHCGASARLLFTVFGGAEDNPNDFNVAVLREQPQDCPATANFDVVRMRA